MACLSCTIRRRNEQMEMEMKETKEKNEKKVGKLAKRKKTHNGVKKYTVKTWKRSRNERMV